MKKICLLTKRNKMIAIMLCIVVIIIIAITNQSCKKYDTNGYYGTPRGSLLIEQVWGLTSARSIDSLSSGAKFIVKGSPGDSLIFGFTQGLSVSISDVSAFIGGVHVAYPINHYGSCRGLDTTTIAYDTIMLGAQWKKGYSDTLFITKTSPTQLVFKVRYSLPTGNGVEIDTFHTVRYF